MVEVALDQYTDIFSEWDPAPFKRVFEKGCPRYSLPPRDSKTLSFECISLRPGYNLRRSLTFQTPSKRRELDPDLQLYLESRADEIPAKYSVEGLFIGKA
jgi:hypothetical protein